MAGQLFMVNPPKRRKSRKRRTAKQKAATRKMIAARKRSLGGGTKRRKKSTTSRKRRRSVSMARRRGRKRATTKRRRRSTKRRSPVTVLRRRSVYVTNPRRRGRRRFRRNPAILKTVQQGAMDAGATLAGGAVARMASGLIPLPRTGLTGVAVDFGVAVLVGYAARQFVGADTARFITAGAMQVPVKNLITSFVPGAGAFLGDYDNIGAYQLPSDNGMGDYISSGGFAGMPSAEEDYVEIGAYSM